MNVSFQDNCPICFALLEKRRNDHSLFICYNNDNRHYAFDMEFKYVIFNSYKYRFFAYPYKNVLVIYNLAEWLISIELEKSTGFFKPYKIVMTIPLFNFDWNDLESLDKKIDSLIIFS